MYCTRITTCNVSLLLDWMCLDVHRQVATNSKLSLQCGA